MVKVWVLCGKGGVEGVNGWQRKGIRCGCGDVRRTFCAVAESCRVLSYPGFVFGVEVLVVVVGSVQAVSGTGCAVLAWRYDLCGNRQDGGKQTQKHLQVESRDLLPLVTFRQLQFNRTPSHSTFPNPIRQEVTPVQRHGAMYRHYLHCPLNNIPMMQSSRILWVRHVARTTYRSNSYRILVGKNQGKSPLLKSTHRKEVNIKMYHKY